jgi:predicted trehalose synthase
VALSERDRVRYARQLLLPQLGEAGQERLLGARLYVSAQADPGALAVAQSYLARAGVPVIEAPSKRAALPRASEDLLPGEQTMERAQDGRAQCVGASDSQELYLSSTAEIERSAGGAELREAARALAGALAAVHAILSLAGLSQPGARPALFEISAEEV